MTSRNPTARHQRFLANGFFPPEMPSCFYSEQLGRYRNSLLTQFLALPPQKNGNPDYYAYKSEKSYFNFPRFQREDRRHAYINPISFFFLSKTLSDNYVKLRSITKKSGLSITPSLVDWKGDRAVTRPLFDVKQQQTANLNALYELLAEADIQAFYHSIYTHAISWAIHGKTVAKKNRSLTWVGNLIDLLVRNAQDGQTVGLPVGPDTSRFIAEIVGAAIDQSIQKALNKRKWSTKERSGMRFVDDYMFGSSSLQDAKSVIAAVRRAVNEFELELNNSKTSIRSSGPFFQVDWRDHLRSMLPKYPYGKQDVARYLYEVYVTAKNNESADVVKFSIQIARRAFLETNEWSVFEDYMLSSYRKNPTVLHLVVELLVLRSLSKHDISLDRVGSFVSASLPALIEQDKIGEVCWLMFLCISTRIPIKSAALSGLFGIEDGAAAVLVSDAKRLGLISGKIDQSIWNRSLTADGLDSVMWLYSYESTLKKLNGSSNDAHVVQHPYFSLMYSKGIEFYRSGAFHLNKDTLLQRLRHENSRRRFLGARIEHDLGENLSDFDMTEPDELDEEDEIY
jgi:Reverse transcriptase (RNA-dependent DNA polymerase)